MAVDTSVTHMIFFIAAVIVAGSLAAALTGIVYNASDDIEDRADGLSEQILTDIVIINDPKMVPYQNNNVTIYVKNIGENYIIPDEFDILIDGQFVSISVNLLEEGVEVLYPGEVADIKASISLSSGDHIMKVTAKGIAEDSMRFRI